MLMVKKITQGICILFSDSEAKEDTIAEKVINIPVT